ncbi:MAG: hypothetical protein IPM18_13530 [Phycisphaerales bacterium]|nr:hypothetical protein [Phycisphaerales bacterium]
MPHLCLFGGTVSRLDTQSSTYFTVFGGTEVFRPPTARLLADKRKAGSAPRARHLFITFCGGTDLNWPTLAEEYIALRDTLQSGALTIHDWDRLIGEVGGDGGMQLSSLTLMGAFESDTIPSESAELDALSLQRHLGHIPDAAVDVLILAIGSKGIQRLAAVRSAIGTTLSTVRR